MKPYLQSKKYMQGEVIMDKYIEPDFTRSVVVIIDMQNDFVLPNAISEIPGSYEVISNILKILNKARNNNIEIIHVIRLYEPNGLNVDICRRTIIQNGTKIVCPYTNGADIVAELKPNKQQLNFNQLLAGEIQNISEKEWVIYKPRWGAFYKTKLEEFLLSKNLNTLIFIGCNFPNCPRASIYEASARDFKIVLGIDAISQIYPKGLEEMKNIGVSLMTTKEIIDNFN